MKITEITKPILNSIDTLCEEIEFLQNVFEETEFFDMNHHFPNAHHGYMMVCMAKIDIISQYIFPELYSQTKRMTHFMNKYFPGNKEEENELCVHMFRHNLMHTSNLNYMFNFKNNSAYTWHIRFDTKMPTINHYTISAIPIDSHEDLLKQAINQGMANPILKCINVDIFKFSVDLRMASIQSLSNVIHHEDLHSSFLEAHKNIQKKQCINKP